MILSNDEDETQTHEKIFAPKEFKTTPAVNFPKFPSVEDVDGLIATSIKIPDNTTSSKTHLFVTMIGNSKMLPKLKYYTPKFGRSSPCRVQAQSKAFIASAA